MPRAQTTCRGCGAPVLSVIDIETDQTYLVDVDPVDQGHVDVWIAGGRAAARRYLLPSRRQPAREPHACHAVRPPPIPDPYADATPAQQQHGGWR